MIFLLFGGIMKKIVLTIILLLSAFSFSSAAVNAYLYIKGTKEGVFKGDNSRTGQPDYMACLGFSYEIKSPRDAASGMATGKRQHQPIRIIKEWGPASPQIFQACCTNEVLTSVIIEFVKVNPDGKPQVFQRVTLTNATISDDRQFLDVPSIQGSNGGGTPMEEISFTFQKIQFENTDGGTSATDDWQVR
jgi:type VI secretion system secreted protein Hcp